MSDQKTKRCSKCGEVKLRAEFNADRSKKYGLCSCCESCEKKYRAENREKAAERHRKYRAKNKEKLAESWRKYYVENKEKLAERDRKYRAKNKEKELRNRKERIEKMYCAVLSKMWHIEQPCCEFCGVSSLPEACYDYHHLDPSEKKLGISRAITRKYKVDEIAAEMQKTIRLCATCHRLFHHVGTPLRNIDQNNIQLKRDENVSERQT